MRELHYSHSTPETTDNDEGADEYTEDEYTEAADLESLAIAHYDKLRSHLYLAGIPAALIEDFAQEGFVRTYKYLQNNDFAGDQKQLFGFVRPV
jgi:hypothetical protein